MSPRTGRPTKQEEPKTVSLQLRITEKTAEKLKRCAEVMKISRTEVIERGIDLVANGLKKQ